MTAKEVRYGQAVSRPSLSRSSQPRSTQTSSEGFAACCPPEIRRRSRSCASIIPSKRPSLHPQSLPTCRLPWLEATVCQAGRVSVTACRMTDAIWRGDADAVRELVLKDPRLLRESARGVADSNWGPPMSYAANVARTESLPCCVRWVRTICSTP